MALSTITTVISLGIAAVGVLAATVPSQRNAATMERLAIRMEQAAVIPEETRQMLRPLIERAKAGSAGAQKAAARIERALQSKPSRSPEATGS